MQKNVATKRTVVHLEAALYMSLELQERARELADMGFDVTADKAWNPKSKARIDVLGVLHADVMLIWPKDVSELSWIKVGYAAGAGLRIIAIGEIPDDVKSFFMLQVPTWDDLTRSNFLKLGDGYFKKGK